MERGDLPAAPGTTWVCAACGKTSRTRYGLDEAGWDEACMMNAVLCHTGGPPWHAVTSDESETPMTSTSDTDVGSNDIYAIEERYTTIAQPSRGYHDSEMFVTFHDRVPQERQAATMERMRAEKAATNMWTTTPKQVRQNVWRINFGYDSGD